MNRRVRQWFAAILTLVLLLGNTLPSLAAGSTERVAKLTAIKGDVKIKLAGGAKPFKAINNMAVTKGDTLFTGKSSSVQLNLDDGSKVVVGSSAQVMVSDLVKNTKGGNQTGIKVQNGQVWSKVKSLSNANDSFKYETPTAVMGIRGTMLFINASLSQSGLWVTEGAVGVANPASPTGREAFVISNERIESTSSEIRGGLIDSELLVQTLDPEILPEAAQDIIHAIYEVAGPNPPNGIGKGLSNEFLKQAKDFVHAAKEKDPTIPVPVDFDQVVEQVIEQIEQHLETNPNPPGVTDSNSNIPPIPENQLHPTDPTSGNSGGGTTSGGDNGDGNGNGGGGGKDDDPVLKEITLEPSSLLLHEGKTDIITIHAKFDDNTIKNITDKASLSVANPQVAAVSQGGIVTAVKAGETTISASFEGKQATASIKVIKDVQSIAITPVITTIKAGKSVQFKATATMIDQTTQDVTKEANWSVTNSDVFWVYPDGMGKAKNVGEVEVTASFDGKSSSLAINVVEDIESIGISPADPAVTVGNKIELKAYSVAEDGSHNSISGEVIWSSSNEKAAIINDKGTVEGLEKGTTTITARYQKWSASTVVTVKSDNFPPKASDVHIAGKPEVGSTLTGSYHYSDDDEDKEGDSIISWYRSDDTNGTNKAAITGATTVQYKVQEADKGKYLSFSVTPVSNEGERAGEKVESAPVGPVLSVGEVESITLTPLNPVVKVADTVQFQVIGKLKDGTTKPLTAGLVWTVSNNAVASIGTNGSATGLDGGSTLITVSYDNLTASTTLTVEKPLVNTPPKATNVTISGTPEVGEMLTGSFIYSDTENDPAGSHLFKWYRANDLSGSGKTVIAGATSTNYTIQIDDAGKFIFFEITPVATKGELIGTPALSAPVSVPAVSGPIVTIESPAKAIGDILALASNVEADIYLVYPGSIPGANPTAAQLEGLVSAGNAKKAVKDPTTGKITIDTISAPAGIHYLYAVDQATGDISLPKYIDLKYGYRIYGDILLAAQDPASMKVTLSSTEIGELEAIFDSETIGINTPEWPTGQHFNFGFKLDPVEPTVANYYFDVPKGTYKITVTSDTTIKEQVLETTTNQNAVDLTSNKLVEQNAVEFDFADYLPPTVNKYLTDTLLPGEQFEFNFSEILTPESYVLIEQAMIAAGTPSTLEVTTNASDVYVKNIGTEAVKFNQSVIVSVQDLGMDTANVTLIELAPSVKSIDVFDDDGTFGDGTYLVLAFTQDLDENSYLSLKSFFSSEFGLASSDTKPYMAMSDTFKITLNSSVPIALGGSFTIPKEDIWDGMNNHPSANQVVVLPNVMTTPQGITIHSFVDSNADPGVVNGTLTFTKAADESAISKYKVYIRDNAAILQEADVTANNSLSYSVAVNVSSSYAAHQYDIQVIPYSLNDHEGHAVTMPIVDSRPTIINTELFDDDSNYGAGSMLAIRFSTIAVNSLSDISQYIANSSEFGSVAAGDISLGNTNGIPGLDTIFVKLYDGIPISQGSSFTIPKEKLYEMINTSYAASDAVLTIPTQMISSNGIVIDPFIDTETDPLLLSGTVTFTKALDETGIKKYSVFLYNNNNSSLPIWSTDAPANGSASHSVTVLNIPIIGGNSYSLVVKPFSTVGHYGSPVSRGIGPEISGVVNGKTYATVTPNVSGSYTTVELKKNGTVVPGYTIGTAITDQGSYVLTVSDSNGNTQAVSFTIQTYASNISISLEPGNEYFSTKFTNALAPGEKLWVKMSPPDGMVPYGSDVPGTAAYVWQYPYFLISQNDILKSITVFITDSDNKVIKWGTSQLNSPYIELPPGSAVAVDLSGQIGDALFTEDEIALNSEEINIHLPIADNSTPYNYKVGDKYVAEFADFPGDPQLTDPYVELSTTTPANAKINVSGYFDQFGLGRDVVIPFLSVYAMDNYTQLPVPDGGKYKTGVPIKVDTRTFVESDLVVDAGLVGSLDEGDTVKITFTGTVDAASKTQLEADFAAMNKFGTGNSIVWTNSDKTVEITLGNGENLEFDQYIYLDPSHITIGGTTCSDPVVEVFLTKP
ncbi:Ig-like domain-containing protein [Brevibacillus sp. SYSU BS000544]|uniref:Ig-like domain-containing protein n=1 Tax=Brevibacillus sp. SYSU BS000544 TaxID=3416443 RepID=UPI003CE51491